MPAPLANVPKYGRPLNHLSDGTPMHRSITLPTCRLLGALALATSAFCLTACGGSGAADPGATETVVVTETATAITSPTPSVSPHEGVGDQGGEAASDSFAMPNEIGKVL